jgi:hypothetical protein
MKRFSSISEWLKTNPSQEEQDKVLILIHRGATSQIRKKLWEKERYLQKLQALANHFKRLNLEFPKSEAEIINKVKKEVEALKKELPVIPKKEKKEKIEEKTEVLAEQILEN